MIENRPDIKKVYEAVACILSERGQVKVIAEIKEKKQKKPPLSLP